MFTRLLLAAFLVAAPAMAQRGRPGIADQLTGLLKLNRSQKANLETILSAVRHELLPVTQEMEKGRDVVAQAMIAVKSQEEIDSLLKTYSALAAEMTTIQTKAFARICAALNPGQLARAGQAFAVLTRVDGLALVHEEGPQFPSQHAGIDISALERQISKFDLIVGSLNLNGGQRKLVQAVLDDTQKETAPLRDEILRTRPQIGEAVAACKSQDEIKPAVESYAALASQMAQLEMKAFTRIIAQLDEKQKTDRQRLGPVFMMMNGLFMGKNWNEE